MEFVEQDTDEPLKSKKIFLVRHAESTENVRSHALISSVNDVLSFKLPTYSKLSTGFGMKNNISINSSVSERGKEQIKHVSEQVRDSSFLTEHNVQVVLHSPLTRARETCAGIFGVVDKSRSEGLVKSENCDDLPVNGSAENGSTSTACNRWGALPVCEMDLLREKTPMEWVNVTSLDKRIAAFEGHLMEEREEDVIVVVGHSQYFRRMLKLDYKFQNCDIWEAQLHSTPYGYRWQLGGKVYSTHLSEPMDYKYLSTF